jgi:putative transposase
MPHYRRDYCGIYWFFTVVTHGRQRILTSETARECLRSAIKDCRSRYPFNIEAWVLLPDHLHAVWQLPEDDLNYSRRWSIIKRRFTQQYPSHCTLQPPYWQKRFWAHRVDDENDYARHMDYTHYNPVKHGLVDTASKWPWSSFHRTVAQELYPADWGFGIELPPDIGNE